MKLLIILKESPIEEKDYSNISSDDRSTLELALSLKDSLKDKLEITTISINEDELLLREALSIGVDNAVLVKDNDQSQKILTKYIVDYKPDFILSGLKSIELLKELSKELNVELLENVKELNIDSIDKPKILSIESNKQTRYSSIGKIFKSYDKEILNL